MTATEPLLRVQDLHVTYHPRGQDPVHAVSGVSFEIRPGEVVAIAGESGSGKSSIAAALVGLGAPGTSLDGSITLGGQDVTRASDRVWRQLRGRQVGFVPQEPGLSLDPIQRIGAQIEEALTVHGMPGRAARDRVPGILAEVGLADTARVAATFPHELSGGMRQRVLIGIGLANDPPLLIADEPTSGLDVSVQRQVLDHLEGLIQRKRVAVLLITHDLGMASDRADRILVMRGGRVLEAGPTRKVFTAPRHPYTAELIAAATYPAGGRPRPTPGAEPIMVVEGLVKHFGTRQAGTSQAGTRPAVDGVSFVVPRRGTTSIVGESGSGKSTTARIMLRLETPSAGSVRFEGQEVTTLSGAALKAFRRRVQVVYQNPYASLDPRFTVEEIIAEPLRAFAIGDRTARGARVSELLDSVGLPDRVRHNPPAALSGGQRQRVAIARALAIRPELVVLDEPVSALDASVQAQILALLRRLQEELGVSYLLISHDLSVVRAVSDHVVVLRHGRVVEQGPTETIFRQPAQDYTRALLSDAPGRRHANRPAG
jgi:peptide/nickel transport system ATP-binding protein